MMTASPPVLFLTFANAGDQSYLTQLKRESAVLRDMLLPLEQEERCKVIREESVDNGDIPHLLAAYPHRVHLFHYGGHADGQGLQFEDQYGRVQGLAELLALQKHLKLVFLNGCNTQEQARAYLSAGIPAVLATTLSVEDSEAASFAENFYRALAQSHTLQEAFKHAGAALKARSAAYDAAQEGMVSLRGLKLETNKLPERPWRLYVHPDKAEVMNWRLPGPGDTSSRTTDSMEVNNYGAVKNQINNPTINGDLNIG